MNSKRTVILRFFIVLVLVFTWSGRAIAETDLSAVGFNIEGQVSGDPEADVNKMPEKISWTTKISDNLPAEGKFFRFSVRPGHGGYPAAKVTFDEPQDFNNYDVLGVWFRADAPTPYFQIVFNSAGKVMQDNSLAGTATGYAAIVKPGIWYRALVHYKAGGWVRYGDKMDFTKIKTLTFYVDDARLDLKKKIYNYELGGMKLYSMAEAKAEFNATLRQPVVYSAAKISDDKDVLIWTADASEKVLKTTPLPDGAPQRQYASTTAAGREYASLLFVINPHRDLKKLMAKAGDLISATGKISAANITLRYVDFVKDAFMDYGDPLPLMAGKELDAKAGDNFMLWATVHIPAGTPAGTYSGVITIQDGQGLSRDLEVKIQVYDFALPEKTHLKSLYTVQHFYGGLDNFRKNYLRHWPKGVKPFNSAYKTMINNIIKNYGQHRVTPNLSKRQFALSFDQKLALAKKYNFDPMFQLGYNIAGAYKNSEPVTDETRKELFETWKKKGRQLKEAGVADISFLKIGDEPKPDFMKYIRMAAEDASAAVPYIQNFVTAKPHESLFGLIDVWCPPWGTFDFMGRVATERKAAGDKFWTYAAEYKANNAYEPMDLRVPYWLYWEYGITGVHYSHHIPSCFLNYPNATYPYSDGLAPIPSIRWEMIRHGIQDYEYLWLLNDLIEKAGPKGREFKHLLKVPENLAKSQTEYTTDPRILSRRRDRIAKAIEKLSSIN